MYFFIKPHWAGTKTIDSAVSFCTLGHLLSLFHYKFWDTAAVLYQRFSATLLPPYHTVVPIYINSRVWVDPAPYLLLPSRSLGGGPGQMGSFQQQRDTSQQDDNSRPSLGQEGFPAAHAPRTAWDL